MSATDTADAAAVTTIKTCLQGLCEFAAAGKANPARHGTNKVHTVMEGQYRSLSFVGDKHAAVVDEPLHQPLSAARDSALRSDEAPARPAFSS